MSPSLFRWLPANQLMRACDFLQLQSFRGKDAVVSLPLDKLIPIRYLRKTPVRWAVLDVLNNNIMMWGRDILLSVVIKLQ